MNKAILAVGVLASLTLAGCTVHPQGESAERQAAFTAGKFYEKTPEKREIPPLSDRPTPDDLVRYALLSNADLENQYWQWRAALEQVPIDGTQATNLLLTVGTTLNEGAFENDRTILSAGNDPMADIAFPPKLSAAAQRSLENARAAGRRFRKAQFELRRRVLDAYDDYALNAELIRLSEENIQLLRTTADMTEARNRSGLGGQQDVLKAHNEFDLARNEIDSMRSELPIQRAALNALLNRSPDAPIPIPDAMPRPRIITASDQEILDRAAKSNPELIALSDEIRAKHEDIHLARLQYYPDFDLSASTDLKGLTQTLMGAFTVPIVRYEALAAAVAQAQDNLRGAEAMRRQSGHDLAAQLVDDLATMRDADRQIELLQTTILPRARQAVSLERTAYQTGSATFLDLLDGQRSLIDIERLAANLQITRDKRVVEIEAIDATVSPF